MRNQNVKYLTVAGLMAALIALMTAYICHVPLGINGGYIHLGDAIIYLAAVLLPKQYAMAAAAIGGGLADLLTAPMWTPATIIIKMLLIIPFTNKSSKIINLRNVFATVIAYLITGFGYFFAEYLIFDTWSVFWVSMSQNLIQSVGSAIVFIVLAIQLDKAKVKTKFFMNNKN